jgi:hypothetical protein
MNRPDATVMTETLLTAQAPARLQSRCQVAEALMRLVPMQAFQTPQPPVQEGRTR